MFLFEQKIKGYRETLISFNKDTVEFGDHKKKLIVEYEEKMKNYQQSLIDEADELKRRHDEYEKIKIYSKE